MKKFDYLVTCYSNGAQYDSGEFGTLKAAKKFANGRRSQSLIMRCAAGSCYHADNWQGWKTNDKNAEFIINK